MQDHDDGAYNTQPHETAESTGSTTRNDATAAHEPETAGTEIGTGPASSTDASDGQERTDTSNDSSDSQSIPDGGQPRCGRRNCSEPDPVTLTDERGRKRARCERHALEDIDGIGVTLADRLLRAFDGLRELYAVCEPYAHADIGPARIARLEGCGTRSAAQISSALATTVDGDSLVSDDTNDQEAQPLAADGGDR
jgi:hypothetical protein